jgi:hypothetical protein
VLGINQRYFSSKKNSVEIFSASMQEVTLKKIYNFQFDGFLTMHHGIE